MSKVIPAGTVSQMKNIYQAASNALKQYHLGNKADKRTQIRNSTGIYDAKHHKGDSRGKKRA